jgi:hypothetical protein
MRGRNYSLRRTLHADATILGVLSATLTLPDYTGFARHPVPYLLLAAAEGAGKRRMPLRWIRTRWRATKDRGWW